MYMCVHVSLIIYENKHKCLETKQNLEPISTLIETQQHSSKIEAFLAHPSDPTKHQLTTN